MPRIFADASTNDEFLSRGYVVRPLLRPDAIGQLLQLHDLSTPEVRADFDISLSGMDTSWRERVSAALVAIVQEPMASVVPDFQAAVGLFIRKRPHVTKGVRTLHQDRTCVDNARDVAVRVWCPLVDVDERNGCLRVVPGSHRFADCITPVPETGSPAAGIRDALNAQFAASIPMPAGSAVFYDSRLLHGSEANQSTEMRVAATWTLFRRNAALRMYSRPDEKAARLDVLEVDERFILTHDNTPVTSPYPPGVRYVESIEYSVPALGEAHLLALERIQRDLMPARSAK